MGVSSTLFIKQLQQQLNKIIYYSPRMLSIEQKPYNHGGEFGLKMQSFALLEELQDFTIICDGNSKKVHKLILATSSSIHIMQGTIISVSHMATYLQISKLREICEAFLGSPKVMKIENCLEIRDIAIQFHYSNLLQKVNFEVESNFVLLPDLCEGFGDLMTEEDVFTYLDTEWNCYGFPQEKVLQTILSWVEHDLPKRERILYCVICHARFPQLDLDFIDFIGRNGTIQSNERARWAYKFISKDFERTPSPYPHVHTKECNDPSSWLTVKSIWSSANACTHVFFKEVSNVSRM